MYFYEDPAAYRVMTKYLGGEAVAPRDAALSWRTESVTARNHRGEYRLSMWTNRAVAYFHPRCGDCELVAVSSGCHAVRDVEHACDAHASALPPYPFLLGWPALGQEGGSDA
jgi:hypothetical protein